MHGLRTIEKMNREAARKVLGSRFNAFLWQLEQAWPLFFLAGVLIIAYLVGTSL